MKMNQGLKKCEFDKKIRDLNSDSEDIQVKMRERLCTREVNK